MPWHPFEGSCSKSVIGVEVSFMQRLAGEWLA
jgi:hypothetical protein